MAELITLRNQKTGEIIYPVTTYKNVFNKKGSNILGYVDHQINQVKDFVQRGLDVVTTEQEKIKKLEGSDLSPESVEISNQISQIIEHSENVNQLEQDKIKIKEEIYCSDNLNISDFINDKGVEEITNTIASEKIFIKYCKVPPTYAPIKNTIKICSNGYAYIGINGIWYSIKLSQSEKYDVITTRMVDPFVITIIIDTDWINSISLWNNNKLLKQVNEEICELDITEFSDILEKITISADLVYAADTLRFFINNQEIELDNSSYSGLFSKLTNGDKLEIKTYNSLDK